MNKLTLPLCLLLATMSCPSLAEKTFTLESSEIKLNSMIPVQFTCEGADTSPPLSWHDAPPKTQSFALVVEDPDANSGVWTHWILFNLPATLNKLKIGTATPAGASVGKNSWETLNYRGPCPPIGAHSYIFTLYALDKVLDFGDGASKDSILQAMTGHVLGSSKLVGLYQKSINPN